MKKILALSFILLTLSGNGFAQDSKVEDKIYGVQAGVFGVWGNGEFQMQKNMVLRTELGFDYSFWIYGDNFLYTVIPVVVVEPRWYYNLNKRELKGKSIENNAGSYLSLYSRIRPNWVVLSQGRIGNIYTDISIIPSWGLRRNMGKHFNFEGAAGLGYMYEFSKKSGNTPYYGGYGGHFTLRLGYTF
jgi:hypothetical protein